MKGISWSYDMKTPLVYRFTEVTVDETKVKPVETRKSSCVTAVGAPQAAYPPWGREGVPSVLPRGVPWGPLPCPPVALGYGPDWIPPSPKGPGTSEPETMGSPREWTDTCENLNVLRTRAIIIQHSRASLWMDKPKTTQYFTDFVHQCLINITKAKSDLCEVWFQWLLTSFLMWSVQGQTLRHECDVKCHQSIVGLSFDKKNSPKSIFQSHIMLVSMVPSCPRFGKLVAIFTLFVLN